MVDYSVFDSLFDSVLVIGDERKIVYCNEAAAMLAGSSVRRLTKGVVFGDVYLLEDPELYPVSGGEIGRESPAPMRELNFSIKNSDRVGKLQVTVQPFSEGPGKPRWVIVMHDVTLEETLHKKYQGELEQKEVYIRELQQAKAQLEDYSKNLEKMVEARTAELRAANRMLNAIMNSLGQGFLVFDRKGLCSDVFTKACEEILECVPAGRPIWEVLRLAGTEGEQFKKWMQAAFSDALPFDTLTDLAPNQYHHTHAKYVVLSFYPIRNDEGSMTNIVLVATDRTREREAEIALAHEQAFSQMVMKVIRNRDRFCQFLENTKALIGQLKTDLKGSPEQFDFSSAFRTLHTLEGESGLFSAALLRDASRHCQEVLEPFRQGENIDAVQVVQELKANVNGLERSLEEFYSANRELFELLKIGDGRSVEISLPSLQNFGRFLREQGSPLPVQKRFCEELLKQPLGGVLRHFDEIAKTVADAQGKQLDPIQFDCDQVRIIPGSLDPLIAALVHAFRNAVDHGLETPDVRLERGKPAAGQIKVVAREEARENGTWISLTISDDGAGMDPAIIREKLAAKFPGRDFAGQSDLDIIQGVFLPGFSSRDSVGAYSGRGIGMDAIKTEVEALGGRARVESQVGIGTKVCLEFPNPSGFELFALSA